TETDYPPVSTNVQGGTKQQYVERWIYNNFGEPIWAISPGGVVTHREYYPAEFPNGGLGIGPVTVTDKPTGHPCSVSADTPSAPPTPQPVQRISSLTAPDERRTNYFYDAHGYLAAIQDARRNRTEFHYDELGALKQQVLPDGPTHDFKHDANGR